MYVVRSTEYNGASVYGILHQVVDLRVMQPHVTDAESCRSSDCKDSDSPLTLGQSDDEI